MLVVVMSLIGNQQPRIATKRIRKLLRYIGSLAEHCAKFPNFTKIDWESYMCCNSHFKDDRTSAGNRMVPNVEKQKLSRVLSYIFSSEKIEARTEKHGGI